MDFIRGIDLFSSEFLFFALTIFSSAEKKEASREKKRKELQEEKNTRAMTMSSVVAFQSMISGRTGGASPTSSIRRRRRRYHPFQRFSPVPSSSSSSSSSSRPEKQLDVVARSTNRDEDERAFNEEDVRREEEVVVESERSDVVNGGEKDNSETESSSSASSATAFKFSATKSTGTRNEEEEEEKEEEEKEGFDGKKKGKMENDHTNKSEKIKNALVQTKTFALNLPFISHVRVFLDRKSKWEKLYGEANEKFADHKKQDELMLELHRFGRVEEIIERFESRKYASGPRSVTAYMAALISSQRMDKYFEHQGATSSSSKTTSELEDKDEKTKEGEGDAKSDLPSSTIPKPPPHLTRSSTATTYQPMEIGGDSLPLLLKDLSERADPDKSLNLARSVRFGRASTPIHVVVEGGNISKVGKVKGFFGNMFMFVGVVSCISWTGSYLLRRYFATMKITTVVTSSPSSSSSSLHPPTSSGSGGVKKDDEESDSGTPSFAPKQYDKDTMPEKNKKTFKDVRGCDECKGELQEVVEYLRNPDKFTRLGGKLPKGILLTGPPGTGKTLLARAVAGEADVPFFYRSGSEFEEMFVGVGSKRVRQLFAAAKKKTPCIVFIDEIDAVGTSRKSWESQSGGRKTLNQLLTEMDGFEQNDGIIVLAATNLPESLDPALTRPGRFDKTVHVPNPDIGGRRDILKHYLDDKPVAKDVDVDALARGTSGLSGAELSNLVNIAAVRAAVTDETSITLKTLEWAKDRILMGTERKSAVLSEENRKLTAYHEAGHALVALKTKGAMPVHKATIVPRGQALGMVTQLPDKDETSISRRQLLARLDVCFGGRVAEEIIFGQDEVTTGALNDLQQATRLAHYMVSEVGMSDKVGVLNVGNLRGKESRGASARLEESVDEEVIASLKQSHTRVTKMLKQNEKDLRKLAEALLQKETLTGSEMREILGMPAQEKPVELVSRSKVEEEDESSSAPKGDEKVDEKTDAAPDEDDLIIVVVGETTEKSTSMRNK